MRSIRIKHIANSCKYHRNPGTEYAIEDLAPKGMCPIAFSVCYPYCLSLLYDAEFSWMKASEPDAVFAQCPTARVACKISRKRSDDPSQKNEWAKEITMEVVERRADQGCDGCCFSDCTNMQVGSRFEFPKGAVPVFCPAAFNQLWPYLVAMSHQENSLFRGRPLTIECPDHATRIRFEIDVREEDD